MSTRNDVEEIYFQKQEQALRAKLREELEADARKVHEDERKLALADRIKALGFTGDRAKVFDLMPLVHVAWADGEISRKERANILEIVASRGIAPGTEPFRLIEVMLEERPSDLYMSETLDILREVIGGKRAESVVELCIQVADVSGGFFGLGETIARAFGDRALAQVHRALSER
ncbi:MAG: TerB family tellurite resistance protein [Myxococcales bacterium]|nr:TerB family tellurite resistance protein [Myxococcales bacterium]